MCSQHTKYRKVPRDQHTIQPEEEPLASKVFAILVELAYLALIVYVIVAAASDTVADLQGGEAAALVGGIAVLVMFGAAYTRSGSRFLETAADHIIDGLVLAFKAMCVVLPTGGGHRRRGRRAVRGAPRGVRRDARLHSDDWRRG